MRLDSDVNTFKQLIQNAARHFKIIDDYVEKDYWLVLLLKQIMSKGQNYVFKGGTSLSKCFRLINRFSEDIDISYTDPFNNLTVNDINRKFKGVSTSIKEIGFEIENKEHLRRNAFFNRFMCPYNSFFNGSGIDKKIIIELAAQTPSFPTMTKTIQSFVGEYLQDIGRNDLVALYELEAYEINVQTLSRTIVDKVFAICDYYLSGKCQKHSRHIYDLYKIVGVEKLDSTYVELFKEVRKYRINNPICLSAKEGIYLHDVINKIIEEDAYKYDYVNGTQLLLYEDVSYEKCVENLRKLHLFLKQNNI